MGGVVRGARRGEERVRGARRGEKGVRGEVS